MNKHTYFDDPDCNKKKLHGGLKPKELHTGKKSKEYKVSGHDGCCDGFYGEPIDLGTYKSKKEAEKFAQKWCKAHPEELRSWADDAGKYYPMIGIEPVNESEE